MFCVITSYTYPVVFFALFPIPVASSHFRLLTSALHTKILSRLKKKNSALQKTSATKILLIKIERENGGGDDDACIGIGIDEMPSEDNWCL